MVNSARIFKLVGIVIGSLIILLLGVNFSLRSKESDLTSQPNLSPQALTSEGTERELYPCSSNENAPLEKVGDFIAQIFPARPDQYDRPEEKLKITTTTFSIKELNSQGKPKEAMFFSITRPNRQVVINIEARLQVCDKKNMMEGPTGKLKENPVLLNRSDNVAYYLHLYQGNIPAKPGNYRLDGYLYWSGKWSLVARFNKITLTE